MTHGSAAGPRFFALSAGVPACFTQNSYALYSHAILFCILYAFIQIPSNSHQTFNIFPKNRTRPKHRSQTLLQAQFPLNQSKSVLNTPVLISDDDPKTGVEKSVIHRTGINPFQTLPEIFHCPFGVLFGHE